MFKKILKSLEAEIVLAENNTRIKDILTLVRTIPNKETRYIEEISIVMAYTEWLKDASKVFKTDKKKTIRV